MEFTINSKQKKVELFYESAKEQAAIMEFISKWLTYKEENIKYQPTYRNDEIAWASNSTSRGMCDGLTGHAYADIATIGTIDTVGSIIGSNDVSNTVVINTADLVASDITSKYTHADLTASEDLPSGCIHVSAKSK